MGRFAWAMIGVAFRAQAAAEQAEAEAIVARRAEAVRRAEFRFGYQQLTAPVEGVINEIAVTTEGERVGERRRRSRALRRTAMRAANGAPLVTIVPRPLACERDPAAPICAGSELIVETLILNRDVGFVRKGQKVTVKLEAYPFTRHGALEGVVEHVSPDAISDERRGLVFPARVILTASKRRDAAQLTQKTERHNFSASSDGGVVVGYAQTSQNDPRAALARAPLSPGQRNEKSAAQVEVITGRRSMLDYLLSPIARATSEAGRER